MEITREKIDKTYQLFNELKVIDEELKNAHNESRKNADEKITVLRRNGKAIVITERTAWEEIYQLGNRTECFEALKEKYPLVFSKTDEHEEKVKEITAFTVLEMDIDAMKLKLSDIFRVVEALVDYKLTQK